MIESSEVSVTLTIDEINTLCSLLRDSAQYKKRRARQVHPNDRANMEASAMHDYELRKKLIAAKGFRF